MDFRESLDYLYGLQQFGIKLGLDNIRSLLARLGHPEARFPVVHVAGTNGKGSVCATLAAILQSAGYRVGLYTSPHLHTFGERIRVNGESLSEVRTVALTTAIREHSAGLHPTFFEFTTAMALQHFAECNIDIAVLEVGMGGRLDATNAVTPVLSIITPVSLDHVEHLGPDLAAIAREKGGIIKPRVPLLLARQETAAQDVLLELATKQEAPVLQAGRDFELRGSAGPGDFNAPGLNLSGIAPVLAGAHQRDNLALALAAVGALRQQGFVIEEEAIRRGVERVRWPGRMESWRNGSVLLDGAHNAAGAQALADHLRATGKHSLRWVVGIKADKHVDSLMAPLLPLCRELYCTAPAGVAALAPQRLVEMAVAAGVPARVCPDVKAALAAAFAECLPGETVLVAGSLFLVAEARAALLYEESGA